MAQISPNPGKILQIERRGYRAIDTPAMLSSGVPAQASANTNVLQPLRE
jgi:hypothetical protein